MPVSVQLDLPGWIILSYLFVIGAIVGSFLNVVIYRIPPHERLRDQLRSLWDRPSQCPRCRKNIPWRENIPIFGWMLLRGRCSTCKMAISPRYPLIEFLNACLWVLVFWLEVPIGFHRSLSESCLFTSHGPEHYPGLGSLSPEAFVLIRYLYHMVLIEALLVASMIDFDLRIIPDGSTVPAMIAAVFVSTIVGRVHLLPVWFQGERLRQSFGLITPDWVDPWLGGSAVPDWITAHPHLHGLAVSVVGLLVGGGMVWIVRLIGSRMLKQEAMGFGDVVLMAMIGAFLGWQATFVAFFIAPVCALAAYAVTMFFRPDRTIPYGPYLSLGAVITLLQWKDIFARVHQIFELGVLLFPIGAMMVVLFAVSLGLVQSVKWVLGFRPPEPLAESYWRSADQTFFFKGETVDRHTCRWRTRDWEGCAAAHGTVHEERWRRGSTSARPQWGSRRDLR